MVGQIDSPDSINKNYDQRYLSQTSNNYSGNLFFSLFSLAESRQLGSILYLLQNINSWSKISANSSCRLSLFLILDNCLSPG
ncbi:hypothetical protein OENI_30009 [Oenococcus oeni]|nr:hypothetical protein OENI_30009 [Oenococcus oeni]